MVIIVCPVYALCQSGKLITFCSTDPGRREHAFRINTLCTNIENCERPRSENLIYDAQPAADRHTVHEAPPPESEHRSCHREGRHPHKDGDAEAEGEGESIVLIQSNKTHKTDDHFRN